MNKVDKSKYQKLRDLGKLNCTIKEAVRKATVRMARNPSPGLDKESWKTRLRQKYITVVPISDNSDRVWGELNTLYNDPSHSRKKNWDAPKENDSKCTSYVEHVGHGRYSSRCTYTRYTYEPVITSYAWIDRHGRLAYQFALDDVRRINAPFGYFWDTDLHGIRLVARSNNTVDYHVVAGDLLDLTSRQIDAKLRANETVRKNERKKARQEAAERKKRNMKELQVIRNAEKEGAHVCLADSVRAGNCSVGTISWCKHHQLNPDLHYQPTKLLKLANGDQKRVALVVAYAVRRHRQEMERGYANVADHILSGT